MVTEKIYQLKEILCDNIFLHGVTTYNITEYSKMSGKRLYKVGMLDVDPVDDDEVILFDDEEMTLLNSNYMLRSFLTSSVDNIRLNKKRIVIDFKTGSYIIIKPVIEAA